MKRVTLVLLTLLLSCSAFGQRTVPLRNLWTRPQVHVWFEGYKLSFSIKDIDRALELLAETGDTTYGLTSGLDTASNYTVELMSGTKMEYRNDLQHMLQNNIGTFLLTAGHAEIMNARHKRLTDIIMDIQPLHDGDDMAYIVFYDPKSKKILFTGRMAADMYKKDLGIE